MRIFSHPLDRRWSAAILVPGLAALALVALTPHRGPLPIATATATPAATAGAGSTAAPRTAHRAAPAAAPAIEVNAAARQQLLRAIVLSGQARPFGFFH